MKKDFDKWNINKKQIHNNNENKFYGQREIWWCSLGTNIGFEQDGTGACGERPVLILKGFSKHVCIVVPLTSSNKKNPYHFYLGKVSSRDAWVITSQIRLIDTKRLINKIGSIENIIFEEIRKTIKDLI